MSELTHFDTEGRARMVDVGEKNPTRRLAIAEGFVRMLPETLEKILNRNITKGDALAVSQLAGIMGAKQTSLLIPLCHPLPLSSVEVHLTPDVPGSRVRIEARVSTVERTGVEMEALAAVSIAALTLYDMCKAVDRAMVIDGICLLEKRGGRSGIYCRLPDISPRESSAISVPEVSDE